MAKKAEKKVEMEKEPKKEAATKRAKKEPEARVQVLNASDRRLKETFSGLSGSVEIVGDIFSPLVDNPKVRLVLGLIAKHADVSFRTRTHFDLRYRTVKRVFGIPQNLKVEVL